VIVSKPDSILINTGHLRFLSRYQLTDFQWHKKAGIALESVLACRGRPVGIKKTKPFKK